MAIAYAYAAIILSFLGGLWWGLAARTDSPPRWLWFASVAPSLIALVTAWPWMVGLRWPGPSLVVLGISLIAALLVDRSLVRAGIAPPGWMALRIPPVARSWRPDDAGRRALTVCRVTRRNLGFVVRLGYE
nr:DUF3429 domain-containing protein [Sphingomonas sp. H160509]